MYNILSMRIDRDIMKAYQWEHMFSINFDFILSYFFQV